MDLLQEGRRVFDVEIQALKETRDALDETFLKILDKIVNCKGKVILTGMGKPGHIAKKLAATFASLGTPAFCLHPGEAMHGDLGMVSKDDLVIAISYSGESDEIINILPNIKLIGAYLVAITGNANSTLAKSADIVQVFPKFNEACYLGLAPTSSTTVTLCYGDALAVVASAIYGFQDVDFGKYHPAGALGKKILLTVDNLMYTGADNPKVSVDATLKEAIVELGKGVGLVTVVDGKNELCGLLTDGDLRRQLSKEVDIYSLGVSSVMTKTPFTIQAGKMAVDALRIMKDNHVSCLPVLDGKTVVGSINLHAIIKAGIVTR